MDLTCEDRLFYFEKNFFTLDGLWIMEVEQATDPDTSLAVDLAVWQKLLVIALRRIKEYLHIGTSTVSDVLKILEFRWTCERWDFEISTVSEDEGHVTIHTCPYKAIMERNPERADMVPRICKEICIPLYEHAIASLNPGIEVDRPRFMGLEDEVCEFDMKASLPKTE